MKKTQKRSWELIFTHFNFDSFALYKMYLQNYFAHTSRKKGEFHKPSTAFEFVSVLYQLYYSRLRFVYSDTIRPLLL